MVAPIVAAAAIGAGGSILGGMMSGKGKKESAAKVKAPIQYMPKWMQQQIGTAMRGMHPTVNIGFGSGGPGGGPISFPKASTPYTQMAQAYYSPSITIPTTTGMNPFASGLAAAMPYFQYQNPFAGSRNVQSQQVLGSNPFTTGMMYPNVTTIRGGQGGGYGF